MTNTEKNHVKRRIIKTIISMLMCLFLMSITVYASTSQDSIIVNKITISSADDVRAKVVVSEMFGPTELGVGEEEVDLFNPATTPLDDFTILMTKEKEVNHLQTGDVGATAPTEIHFSKDNVYTFVAYKFLIVNQGKEEIIYNITSKTHDLASEYVFSNQLSIYTSSYEEDQLVLNKSTNNKVEISGVVGNVEGQNSIEVYVVIAVNVSLLDIAGESQQDFALECILGQYEP